MLCQTCRHSTVARGANGEVLVHCHSLEADVRFDVVRCNEYEGRSTASLHEMKQVAWRISVDRKTKQVGFVSPQEWASRPGNRYLDD